MPDDDYILPFGMHKGKRIGDVPVKYLHWMWHEATGDNAKDIHAYIKQNLDVLVQENKDLIWNIKLH